MIVFLILFGFSTPAFTQVPKENYFGDGWDVLIRTHWNYEVVSHQKLDEPDCPPLNPVTLYSQVRVVLERDFVDYKLVKAVVPGQSPIYTWQMGKPDFLDLQQWDYSEILNSPFFRCDCRPKRWEERAPGLFLPTLLYLNPKGDFVSINPGVDILTSCRCYYKAKKIPYCDPDDTTRQEVSVKPYDFDGKLNYLFDQEPFTKLFFITPKDLETLIKEGYWKKTFTEVQPIGNVPSSLAGTEGLPTDILIDPSIQPWEPPKGYRVELVVEIFAEPRIVGPHYLANPNPKQIIEPVNNHITLRVDPIPGWQVGEIRPVDDPQWTRTGQYVKKLDQAPPPMPTLTLGPVKPGKVAFEIEWTSPKGKKGKSPPFEVTVVQLEFKKTQRCKGFDDGPERTTAPAVSLCTGVQKDIIEVTIEPRGTSVSTKLESKDPGSFSVSPQTFANFPQKIILNGIHKKRSLMSASIKADEDKFQKSAQMFVDVLDPSPLKVLPIVLATRTPITPHVDLMFNNAKEDLTQTCVELKRMPDHFLTHTQVPNYQDGPRLLYGGAGEEELKNFARQRLMKGQDLTAFFIPDIATEVVTPHGTVYEPNPHGYQTEVFIFAKTTSEYPHMFAHEIGHFLLKERYLAGSMDESLFHTQDPLMLMHYYLGDGCEIRQEEWRDLHP